MILSHNTCIELEDWTCMVFNITITGEVVGGEEDSHDTPGTDTEATLTSVVINSILVKGSPVMRKDFLPLFGAVDKICLEFVEANWEEFEDEFIKLASEEAESLLSDKYEN
jgi:hypothetical protein